MTKCLSCKFYKDMLCKNPDSPYGAKPRMNWMGCYAGKKRV